MKKILHIINSLDTGGAESSLLRLINNDNQNTSHRIILLKKGIKLLESNKKNYANIEKIYQFNYFTIIFYFFHLAFLIYKIKPDKICCWMYHSCIIGGLAAKLTHFKNIYWLVRHNDPKAEYLMTRTKFSMFVFKLLSYLVPNAIIYNSTKSVKSHKVYGVNQKIKNIFIPNGYKKSDDNFKKIEKSKIVFANICRWDRQKNHILLIQSLSIFNRNNPNLDWEIILGGNKVDENNIILTKNINYYNLSDKVKLIGNVSNIVDIFSRVDFYIQSSADESFPNIVAEAMLYETPVIGTNVGDTSKIIDNFGWCTTLDQNNISETIEKALEYKKNRIKWNQIKKDASRHILKNFSIQNTISKYYLLWNNNPINQ